MPFRDHFRPPVSKKTSWEGFHGGWPMMMVQHLMKILPQGYSAEPRTRMGAYYEIDIGTFEDSDNHSQDDLRGLLTASGATLTMPAPTFTLDQDFPLQDGYEVLIFDSDRNRELVAAIELVSPSNKDRPEHRQMFVSKCANLLQMGVSVSIVDPVTIRRFNLYAELLSLIDQHDPAFAGDSPSTYVVTCRSRKVGRSPRFDAWTHRLEIGQPLPSLPIWLNESTGLLLNLEESYEETCRTFRIAE
jgi:Protein of unknown function (DUF4058)